MRIFGFLFDTESIFGRIMTKIGILVVSNLMFLLCCIPVVTAGASLTALYRVMMRELRSPKDINPFYEFWYGFKTNFKQATICWISALFLLFLGWFDICLCRRIGGLFSYLEIVIWTVGCTGLVILMYLFPTICAFQDTVLNLIKNDMFFIMKKPLVMVGVAACNAVPLMMTFLDEVNQPTYAFAWFFGGFALVAWGCSWLLLRVFSEYLG